MSVNQPTPPPCTGTLYTVAPGDTLASIASAFGLSLAALVAANPQLIAAEQSLCIPAASANCCVVLAPTGVGPAGASGAALVAQSAGIGGATLLVAAINLPSPSTLGNFDTYFARLSPPGGVAVTFALGLATASPQPVYAGGTAGVTTALSPTTSVLVFPGTASGVVGPVVLQGSLASCG